MPDYSPTHRRSVISVPMCKVYLVFSALSLSFLHSMQTTTTTTKSTVQAFCLLHLECTLFAFFHLPSDSVAVKRVGSFLFIFPSFFPNTIILLVFSLVLLFFLLCDFCFFFPAISNLACLWAKIAVDFSMNAVVLRPNSHCASSNKSTFGDCQWNHLTCNASGFSFLSHLIICPIGTFFGWNLFFS